MCHHTWSFVPATNQTRSSSKSTKRLREAARFHRVRVDCRASYPPEKAGGVTGLLRHTGGDGRRGRFPHRAVEAWHVQRRHALRSGAFDNWRSHHFCIPPGSARFQCGRGYVEAPPVLRRRCCWGQRVSSLPGNLYVLRVNEGQQGFCHLRLGLRAINDINAGFFRKNFSKKIWKNKSLFCFPRKPLFSCVADCFRD